MEYISTVFRYGYNYLNTSLSAPIEIVSYWKRHKQTQRKTAAFGPQDCDFEDYRLFVEFRLNGHGPYINYFDNRVEFDKWFGAPHITMSLMNPGRKPIQITLVVGESFEMDIYPQVAKYLSMRGTDLDLLAPIMDILEQDPMPLSIACMTSGKVPSIVLRNAMDEEATLTGPELNLKEANYQ